MLVMAQNNLLIMLENTDAWFVMLDKPPQDLNEDLLNTEDFPCVQGGPISGHWGGVKVGHWAAASQCLFSVNS
jgi:hypothetical protein